jgi:hypothetical protein
MANFTHYSGNLANDRFFGLTTLTPPSIYYLAVSTTAIQKDGTGLTEPTTDTAYARIAISNNKTNFSVSATSILNNLVEFTFPESTINWGTVTHWALCDAATGGNIWFAGELPLARNVEASTTLVLPVGSFQNTML